MYKNELSCSTYNVINGKNSHDLTNLVFRAVNAELCCRQIFLKELAMVFLHFVPFIKAALIAHALFGDELGVGKGT